MPLMPKRVKRRKVQRGSLAGNAHKNNKLDFGDYGLQVLDRGWITNRQIEAARVAATRHRAVLELPRPSQVTTPTPATTPTKQSAPSSQQKSVMSARKVSFLTSSKKRN